MEVRNCKSCGRIFNYLAGPPLCQSCLAALDKKFGDVKEYVYDHPGVGMQEVSEVMSVPIAQIKQWIREERLSFSEDSMIGLECEGCGVTIKTGRFCKNCKDKLTKGFNNLYEQPKGTQKEKDPRLSPKINFVSKEYKKEQ